MKECPFCDGQGIVCRAEVKKFLTTIYICDECDTVWQVGQEISEENSMRFEDFMCMRGLEPSWSELNAIVKEWDDKQ